MHLTCFSDLDEESVRNFLRANPSCLEYYVMNHVDQDRLERWLIRKTRKLKNKGAKKASNSLDHDDNKQSGKVIFDLSLMKPKLMNAALSWKLDFFYKLFSFFYLICRSTSTVTIEMEGRWLWLLA